MIKFFRKIRQKLLSENKLSKYLIYAIGEIVLVVIGILIALYINNKNQYLQQEAKIESIFESILDELSGNILEFNEILEYERIQDSLLAMIINDQLTVENFHELQGSTMNYQEVQISENAFHNLVSNIDAIPIRYQEAYSRLNLLYTNLHPDVILFSERVSSIILDETLKWANTKSWYYKMINEGPYILEFKEYALKDPMFKNYAANLKLTLSNHRNKLEKSRYNATQSYLLIYMLLGKKNELPDFISSESKYLSTNILEKYHGIFELKDNPQTKMSIASDNGYLIMKYEWVKNVKIELFSKSETEFYNSEMKIFFDKNSKGKIIGCTQQMNNQEWIYLRSE